jgi:hypothetical protein
VDAARCNDDRLARTLDTIAPHLDVIWQDLVVAAITAFDLDLRYLCYDPTSMSFCGDDEEADLVRYGYSRDHRPDRKQINLAATVTATGGVPLDYRRWPAMWPTAPRPWTTCTAGRASWRTCHPATPPRRVWWSVTGPC